VWTSATNLALDTKTAKYFFNGLVLPSSGVVTRPWTAQWVERRETDDALSGDHSSHWA
jgi:hypothetical protein